MSDIDLLGLLCQTELFSGLSTEQMRAVARAVEFKEYPAGRKIVRQGAAGEEFFIIAKGEAQVLVEDELLHTQQVALTLRTGQSFGETALLAEEQRSATVQAIKPTICAVLSRHQFQQVLTTIPEIAVTVCHYLAVRLAVQCRLTGFRFVSAAELNYDPRAYQIFPESLLRRCEAIPIGLEGRTVTVALTRPNDPQVVELLRREIPGMGLEPVGCTREDYEAFYTRYRGQTTREVTPAFEEGRISLQYADGRRLCSPLRMVLESALNQQLDYAVVETDKTGACILAEVGGRLQPLLEPQTVELSLELQEELDGVLGEAGQCGETEIYANGHRVMLSLSVLKAPNRKRYSLQLSDGHRKIPRLDELILSPPLLALAKEILRGRAGFFLLEGPRESGLSTTLLSLAQFHAQEAGPGKTLLLEQQSRTKLEEVESWPIKHATAEHLSIAERQRASLLAIDEVWDDSLQELLGQSAVGTNVLAVFRGQRTLLDSLAQDYRGHLPGLRFLRLILRQKLAFRVCEGCRRTVVLSSSERDLLRESGLDNPNYHYFRGLGCESCGGSGIAGRIPVFEAVRVSPELLAGLNDTAGVKGKALRDATVHPFQDYARALIAQGIIDPTEGLRLFPPASAAFALPRDG